MRAALKNRPITDFQKPDTVITATIDPSTGYLATPECPDKKDEFFVAGTEPKEYCPKHGGDLLNQQLHPTPPDNTDMPNSNTPPESTVSKPTPR